MDKTSSAIGVVILTIALGLLFYFEGGGNVIDAQREYTEMNVTMVFYDDYEALNVEYNSVMNGGVGNKVWGEKSGFATSSNQTNNCTIHVVKLTADDARLNFITWGHELAHCVYGAWHVE